MGSCSLLARTDISEERHGSCSSTALRAPISTIRISIHYAAHRGQEAHSPSQPPERLALVVGISENESCPCFQLRRSADVYTSCRWCRPGLSHVRGTAELGCPCRTNCLCLPLKLCNVSNFSPEKGHAQLPIRLLLRMETSDFPFTLAGNLPAEPCQDREREALSTFHRIRS